MEQGQVYRINFTLQPGGVIKGKVTDAGGRPLQDGDVFYQDGNTSYGVSIDRDGTYRIEGLAPGQYKVSVMTGDKEVSRDVTGRCRQGSGRGFCDKIDKVSKREAEISYSHTGLTLYSGEKK